MKQVDLIISKDQEIKRLNDEIRNLAERIATQQISLGSKDELLKSKVEQLERELELAKNEQRVIIKGGDRSIGTYVCKSCGYAHYEKGNRCLNCGFYGSFKEVSKSQSSVEYKNLDDVIQDAKKDAEKKLKIDVSKLEDVQLDLEIKVEELERKLARETKSKASDIEEVNDKIQRRTGKVIEQYRKEVEDLKEEITKIKKNKTDDELEKKRKDEMAYLKLTIDKLNERLEESKKLNFFQRLFNSLFGMKAKIQAQKELELEKSLIRKITSGSDSGTSLEWFNCYGAPYYYGTTSINVPH